MRWVLRSKLHKAHVIEANPEYVGSLALDKDLLERCGFWPGEKILVASVTSGNRLETYLIEAPSGSGFISVNGAAAHLIKAGEEIIVMGFELSDRPLTPTVVLVDKGNKFDCYLSEGEHYLKSLK